MLSASFVRVFLSSYSFAFFCHVSPRASPDFVSSMLLDLLHNQDLLFSEFLQAGRAPSEGLVVSAIYDLGQRVIEANLAALHNPADGADPRDFKPPGATTPR